MPVVVCDSSTLIHLARIGRLSLLTDFHSKIIVVPAVWKEVVDEGQSRPGSSEIRYARESGWIEVTMPHNGPLVQLLLRELHKGESETIALAVELHADLVFLDENDARRVAKVYGLNISGVVGILIRAKLAGKVASLRNELDSLRTNGGFWIGNDVYNRALNAVGEN
jgi:predicted nucleic acid-binding protein